MPLHNALASLALAASAFAVTGAHAASSAELAYHPALAKARPTPTAIDASTFIPGHPAHGTAGAAPAPAAPVAAKQPTVSPSAARAVAAAR